MPRARDIRIEMPGHRYTIPHLDGNGETIVQFVSKEPLHRNVEGIQLQDLARVMIDRLRVLNEEAPWEGNKVSIQGLQEFIARQEARALMRGVEKGKLQFIEHWAVGEDGHLDWSLL